MTSTIEPPVVYKPPDPALLDEMTVAVSELVEGLTDDQLQLLSAAFSAIKQKLEDAPIHFDLELTLRQQLAVTITDSASYALALLAPVFSP